MTARLPKFWMLPYPHPFPLSCGAFQVPAVADRVRVPIQPRLVAATLPAAWAGMDFDGRRVIRAYESPRDGG